MAVKPTDIKTDNNRLTLDVTKEQLQQMANYHLRDPNTGSGTSPSPVHGGRIWCWPLSKKSEEPGFRLFPWGLARSSEAFFFLATGSGMD